MAHDSRVQGYRLPRVPTVKAPIAETTSERSKMKWSTILLVANAEITTVTGCMFAIEDIRDRRDDNELHPKWRGLQIPRNGRRAITS